MLRNHHRLFHYRRTQSRGQLTTRPARFVEGYPHWRAARGSRGPEDDEHDRAKAKRGGGNVPFFPDPAVDAVPNSLKKYFSI